MAKMKIRTRTAETTNRTTVWQNMSFYKPGSIIQTHRVVSGWGAEAEDIWFELESCKLKGHWKDKDGKNVNSFFGFVQGSDELKQANENRAGFTFDFGLNGGFTLKFGDKYLGIVVDENEIHVLKKVDSPYEFFAMGTGSAPSADSEFSVHRSKVSGKFVTESSVKVSNNKIYFTAATAATAAGVPLIFDLENRNANGVYAFSAGKHRGVVTFDPLQGFLRKKFSQGQTIPRIGEDDVEMFVDTEAGGEGEPDGYL